MGKIWLKSVDPNKQCCGCEGKTSPCDPCCVGVQLQYITPQNSTQNAGGISIPNFGTYPPSWVNVQDCSIFMTRYDSARISGSNLHFTNGPIPISVIPTSQSDGQTPNVRRVNRFAIAKSSGEISASISVDFSFVNTTAGIDPQGLSARLSSPTPNLVLNLNGTTIPLPELRVGEWLVEPTDARLFPGTGFPAEFNRPRPNNAFYISPANNSNTNYEELLVANISFDYEVIQLFNPNRKAWTRTTRTIDYFVENDWLDPYCAINCRTAFVPAELPGPADDFPAGTVVPKVLVEQLYAQTWTYNYPTLGRGRPTALINEFRQRSQTVTFTPDTDCYKIGLPDANTWRNSAGSDGYYQLSASVTLDGGSNSIRLLPLFFYTGSSLVTTPSNDKKIPCPY